MSVRVPFNVVNIIARLLFRAGLGSTWCWELLLFSIGQMVVLPFRTTFVGFFFCLFFIILMPFQYNSPFFYLCGLRSQKFGKQISMSQIACIGL